MLEAQLQDLHARYLWAESLCRFRIQQLRLVWEQRWVGRTSPPENRLGRIRRLVDWRAEEHSEEQKEKKPVRLVQGWCVCVSDLKDLPPP